MLGGNFGYTLANPWPPGSGGGGGGGLEITGYQYDQFVQSTNFTAGSVTLTLSQIPIDPKAVTIDYNGDRLSYNVDFSISGNTVTILFGDAYVTDYDANPVFQANYPY